MTRKSRNTGGSSAIPAGIGLSVITCLIIMLLGCAISAYLLYIEVIHPESIGYASMVVLALCGAGGALVAVNKIKHMRLQMCLLIGVCFHLILLCITALFFGGQYEGVWQTALIILCSCGSVALIQIMDQSKGNKSKFKKGYR